MSTSRDKASAADTTGPGDRTRAQPDAGVAVEILVKEDQVTPVRVALVPLRRAGRRARPIGTSQEQALEPLGQLRGHLPEREHPTGPGRALDFQPVAVIVMVPLQCLYDQIVDRIDERMDGQSWCILRRMSELIEFVAHGIPHHLHAPPCQRLSRRAVSEG
jgi:hypothetical protein